MSFITSVSNAESTPIFPIKLEPTLGDSVLPDLQTLIYSHLTIDELSDVEKANKELEQPTNIDRALKVQKELILKENPEYKSAIEAWNKEKVGLSEQVVRLRELREFAFGTDKWLKHFGEVGEVPPLPADIHQILNGNCPFEEGKKVKDTHMLVLIPKTVAVEKKEPLTLTLKSLGELVKDPKVGNKMRYSYLYAGEHVEVPVEKSHWALMTKDVIPGSRSQRYDEQVKMVEKAASYQVPHAIDAAVSILMTYVNTGNRLFGDKPLTYTRCQERVAGYPMVVGGFGPSGLHVFSDGYDYDFYGVVGARKF